MTGQRNTIRWIVRREPTRQPRFGETRRDVMQWAVRQYFRQGNHRIESFPTFYPTAALAADAARRACAARYGCRKHQHTRRPPMRPARPYGGAL